MHLDEYQLKNNVSLRVEITFINFKYEMGFKWFQKYLY
jgi:hypothetical protein